MDNSNEGAENRIPRSSTVRRRLFQDDDEPNDQNNDMEHREARLKLERENTANAFMEILRRQTDEMSRKYNFDFENEQPLPGNYQWERVVPECSPVVQPNLDVASEQMDCDVDASSKLNGTMLVQEETPKKSPINKEKD